MFSSNCVIVLVAPELSLKTNVVRRYMEKKLWENMRAYIKKAKVEITDFHFVAGRVLINTKEPKKLITALKNCFGIHTMFEAERFPISSSQDITEFTKGIAQYVHGTFAVRGRSLTKKFSSMGLERECGSAILSVAPKLKVKLVDPDSEVFVLAFDKEAIVYFKGVEGAGGMPVGSQGIAALLFDKKNKKACLELGKKLLKSGCRLLLVSDDEKWKGLSEFDEWNAYKLVKVISIHEAKSRYADDRIAAFFSTAHTVADAHKESELVGVKVFAPLLLA